TTTQSSAITQTYAPTSPSPTPIFFFSSRRRHTRFSRDWSSDVCSSDLGGIEHSEQFGPSRLHVSVVDGVVDMTQRVAFVETNLQRGNQRHILSSLFGS